MSGSARYSCRSTTEIPSRRLPGKIGELFSSDAGEAACIRCRRCNRYLGCRALGDGIAVADRDGRSGQLLGSSLISQRTVSLKCECGFVTRWRRPP